MAPVCHYRDALGLPGPNTGSPGWDSSLLLRALTPRCGAIRLTSCVEAKERIITRQRGAELFKVALK